MRWRRFAVFATAVVLCGTSAAHAADSATTEDTNGKLMLVLDSSGSMKESASGGGSKIGAAKAALKRVVKELPDDSQVGMRVFGATVESAKDKGACTDTQNVVPVGQIDRKAFISQIDSYKPYGETPIGNALKGAAADLGTEGKRTIVLLSDGEPTCEPDPCKVARDLRKSGVDLRVNVVGLSVSGKARKALQCIADAGGGTYYDASDPQELASSLVTVSVRSLREFSISGKPITSGRTASTATPVRPGQYTDASGGTGNDNYYLVGKPRGGSVSVSVTARPPGDGDFTQSLNVELLTTDGTSCAKTNDYRVNVLRTTSILSSAAYFAPDNRSESLQKPCLNAKKLVARIFYDGSGTRIPYELVVRTFPKITNLTTLPSAVDPSTFDDYVKPVAAQGAGKPVIGGASFNDAPRLTPGVYTDSLRAGEQLIYRVPVGWGQAPRVSITPEAEPNSARVLDYLGTTIELGAFNPLRQPLQKSNNGDTGVRSTGRYNGEDVATWTAAFIPARQRNIEPIDTVDNQNAMAGDYYIAIEMGAAEDDQQNFAAPLTIAVAVDGKVTGKPAYAIEPTDSRKSSKGGGRSPAGLWIGIGVLALVLAATATAVLRRRRHNPHTPK